MIENKGSKKIEEQIKGFAREKITNLSDGQIDFLSRSKELSKIEKKEDIPENLRHYYDDYVVFLKKDYKDFERFINNNKEVYEDKFRGKVLKIKKQKEEVESRDDIPGYLGAGFSGEAYKINVDGGDVVCKFFGDESKLNFELKSLLIARDIPRVAKLNSFSYDDKVIITDFMSGKSLSKLSYENTPDYSDGDVNQLLDMINNLYNKGLKVDLNPDNIFYDENDGFGIIDFYIDDMDENNFNKPKSHDYSLPEVALRLVDLLNPIYGTTTEKISNSMEKYLSTLHKFIEIIKDKYPNIIKQWNDSNINSKEIFKDLFSQKHLLEKNKKSLEIISKIKKIGFNFNKFQD